MTVFHVDIPNGPTVKYIVQQDYAIQAVTNDNTNNPLLIDQVRNRHRPNPTNNKNNINNTPSHLNTSDAAAQNVFGLAAPCFPSVLANHEQRVGNRPQTAPSSRSATTNSITPSDAPLVSNGQRTRDILHQYSNRIQKSGPSSRGVLPPPLFTTLKPKSVGDTNRRVLSMEYGGRPKSAQAVASAFSKRFGAALAQGSVKPKHLRGVGAGVGGGAGAGENSNTNATTEYNVSKDACNFRATPSMDMTTDYEDYMTSK
jgi:hypothetical protein